MKQWIVFCVACFVMLKCTDTWQPEEIPDQDTIPPTVNITYPHDGQIIHCCQDTIDIKAEATDNIGIFYVNFSITSSGYYVHWTDYIAPYIYEKWTPPHHYNPTDYEIQVSADDSSRNRSYDYITIIVEH